MAKSKIIINEDDFPPNDDKPSRKTAPIREIEIIEEGALIEEEKPKRLAQGKIIRKKKSITRSIADTFFGESAKEVGSHILLEVLVPAFKNMVQDMVTQGIERFLYGDDGGPSRRSRDRNETHVSYGKYYSKGDRSRRPSKRRGFELEEIYFPRPKEANDVLEELCDQLENYEQVTVANYFELAGIDEIDWVHSKWGWSDLRRSRVIHTRNGWTIMFPEPEELD